MFVFHLRWFPFHEVKVSFTLLHMCFRSRVRFMLEAINALKNNNMRKVHNHDPTILEDAKKLMKVILKGKGKNICVHGQFLYSTLRKPIRDI